MTIQERIELLHVLSRLIEVYRNAKLPTTIFEEKINLLVKGITH